MISKHKYTKLLKHLKIPQANLLGQGMEGLIFNYSEEKVLKIWFRGNKHRLKNRKKLYETVQKQIQVPVPEIYNVAQFGDLTYTIEKKIMGQPGHLAYAASSNEIQKKLLDNYFDLLQELKFVSINGQYGQLVADSHEKIQTTTWNEYIKIKLQKTLEKTTRNPDHNIKNLDQLFDKFFKEEWPRINKNVAKNLVHGDLFLENIMVNQQGQVTGLLDFGSLSLIGDHLIDVAALTYTVTISDEVDKTAETYLLKKTKQKYSNKLKLIRVYTLFYCLLFINSLTYDPRTYAWCIKNLQRFGYLN